MEGGWRGCGRGRGLIVLVGAVLGSSGMLMMKTDPAPGADSTRTSPPCAVAMAETMFNPRPEPWARSPLPPRPKRWKPTVVMSWPFLSRVRICEIDGVSEGRYEETGTHRG